MLAYVWYGNSSKHVVALLPKKYVKLVCKMQSAVFGGEKQKIFTPLAMVAHVGYPNP